jgi:thiamine biosynthesis lipoprotein
VVAGVAALVLACGACAPRERAPPSASGVEAPSSVAARDSGAPPAADGSAARFEYRRVVMGAPCTIALWARDEAHADRAARAAFARLAEIEEALSDWMPASETRRLPQTAGATVRIGPDLHAVLLRAGAYWEATGGAFDPTVAPVVAVWREARRAGRMPDMAAIEEARTRVGFERIRIGRAPPTYTALADGVRLDFGGIGQGFGAAAALAVLRREGVEAALVDLSGDVAAGDPPPGREGWVVEALGERLLLANAALVVSGDSFQHVDAPGTSEQIARYSHIVDPRTGMGVATRTQVAVIAPDPVDADALATALTVLGPERGQRVLARFPGVVAEWTVERADAAPRRVRSPGWPGVARAVRNP